MKRTATLLLLLALTLLTSCELMVPGPTERPSIGLPAETGGPVPTETADPVPSRMPWQEGVGPDFDRRFSQFGHYVCATGDSVYFNTYGDNLIRYVDKATGICLPLCGKPECLHIDDTCNAYLYGAGYGAYCLANYDGRLYWVGQSKNTRNRCIFSMAYDGTDRRTHRELDSEVIGSSFTNWNLQFHRGYLYWSYQAQEVVDAEARETARVIAFPIDSDGESFVIFDESLSDASLNIQSYGDSVYIHIHGVDEGGFFLHLYRWDVRKGKLETLYHGNTPCLVDRDFWVTEDGIMLLGEVPTGPEEQPWASREYNVYRFSFESGEIEQMYRFQVGGNMNIIAADGVFVGNMLADSNGIRILVKDFAGQTVLDTVFEDVDWNNPPGFMSGFGMDESYLYFFMWIDKFIAVSRDGSEIKLLWTSGAGSY